MYDTRGLKHQKPNMCDKGHSTKLEFRGLLDVQRDKKEK